MGDDGVPIRTYILTNVKAEEVSLSGTKTWQKPESVEGIDLPEVTIQLEVKDSTGEVVEDLTQTETVSAANGWDYRFDGVPLKDAAGEYNTFSITEVLPEDLEGVSVTQVSATDNQNGGVDFVNRWNELVTLNLEKAWDDTGRESLRPDSVTFQVTGKAGGTTVSQATVTLTAAEDWKARATGLPRWYYTDDGTATEIEYTVTENIVNGYKLTGTVRTPESGYTDRAATWTLTNAVSINMVHVVVQKSWLSETNSPVDIVLKGDLGVYERTWTETLSEENDWKTDWYLPASTEVNGVRTEYVWSVQETVPEGWELVETRRSEKPTSSDELTITFTLVNTRRTTVAISGQKLWQNPGSVEDSDLPDVTVTLRVLKNGETVDTQTTQVTADTGWAYTFANVPTVDTDGTAYTYEITEPETIPVEGGAVTQVKADSNATGGVDFTNRWQEYVTVKLTKVWKDAGYEGLRPDSIAVQVNGTVSGSTVSQTSVRLTAADDWKKEAAGLPRWYYAQDGTITEIEYSVSEETVSGYKAASVTEEGGRSFIITNEIDTIDVSGRTLWQKPAEAGLPDKVTVTLKVQKNGETVLTLTCDATAANGWTYSFANVPAAITEDASYSYDITAPQQMTVTDGVYSQLSAVPNDTNGVDFTYRLQKSVAIKLSKVWVDEDNLYGSRPDQILFHVVTTVGDEVIQE